MFLECLGYSSMRLGVPFIAPRQLGAVGGQQGRSKLPSVGWCIGQPLFMSGARSPSYSGVEDRCRFVAVGAPDTVRCPMSTVGAGHASPRDCAVDRCAGGRWLTGQFGAPPDSPVNYSRTPPNSPESDLFTGVQPGAPDTIRCPPDSPVCRTEQRFGCTKPSFLVLFFSLFLPLRQHMLVLKTMY
jgi:hypothetical protein